MIDRIRVAAIALVLAAASGTAYELLSGGDLDTPPVPNRAVAPRATPPSRAEIVQHWAADILARPLIYPGRRAPAPAAAAVEQAPAEPMPRLAGVIVGPAGRSALFVPGQGGRTLVLQEGAHVGPYVIRTIRSNEVVLEGPEGTRLLHPTYDDAPQPSEPAPALPKRARLEPGALGVPARLVV